MLAALIGAAWLSVHLFSVFGVRVFAEPWLAAGLIVLQTWLYVGLFIVAHDAIHETLFGRGNVWNTRVGRLIHLIYAGFDFDEMKTAHIAHHDFPGSDKDPDFDPDHPTHFLLWFRTFFTRYFRFKQVVVLSVIALLYLVLGARIENLILMWAVPSILSSVQLFYFGTYLTHRHGDAFADHHNARSNTFPGWLSLLTCFHFGYHHEHHLYPHEPWWRLPVRRRETLARERAEGIIG